MKGGPAVGQGTGKDTPGRTVSPARAVQVTVTCLVRTHLQSRGGAVTGGRTWGRGCRDSVERAPL